MIKKVNKAPIIGFVRYSQKVKFGNTKKERDVFEADYFEYRFGIFKNITLKSFQQQTNQNFVLLLLHSENMPSHYKQRFFELEQSNSFLYNIFVKDTQESFDEALANSVDFAEFKDNVAVTFRIDNDDAVQNDFIEILNNYLTKEFVNHIISIPMFYIVKQIKKHLFLLQERYFPANAIGLANVTNKEHYKTVFSFGDHDLVNNENTVVLLPNFSNGGLMTVNGVNEINTIDKTKAIELSLEDLKKFLLKRKIENLDIDFLRILNNENKLSSNKLINIIRLFTPPIFVLSLRKLKNFKKVK